MDSKCHMLASQFWEHSAAADVAFLIPEMLPHGFYDEYNSSIHQEEHSPVDSVHCLGQQIDESFTFAEAAASLLEGCSDSSAAATAAALAMFDPSTPRFGAATISGTGSKRKSSYETDVSCITTCTTSDQDQVNVKLEESDQGKSHKKKRASSNKDITPKEGFVHVRARRGQATDSHSLAERARREKISQRMKFLQSLVPGCSKITGKALMLDEIINYVQSLQQQVEYLSTKMSTINSQLELALKEMLYQQGRVPTFVLKQLELHQQQQSQAPKWDSTLLYTS